MGGVLIAIAILLAYRTVVRSRQPLRLGGCVFTLAFGAIGFADDYIKVVQRRSLGLTARAKLFWQGRCRSLRCGLPGHSSAIQALFHAVDRAVHQKLASRSRNGTGLAPSLIWACWRFCPSSSCHALPRPILQCCQPDRCLDGFGHRLHTIIAAAALAVLTYVSWPRGFCRLPRTPAHAHGRRADRLLRFHGGCLHRLSLVQRPSCGNLHG